MKTYTTPDYLDLFKKSLDLKSDYQVHKVWGIARGYVSLLRCGKQSLTSDQCEEIAKVTGVPLTKVLADIQIERALRTKNPTIAAAWKKIANLVEQNNIAMMPALMLMPLPGHNIPVNALSEVTALLSACILCQIPEDENDDLELPPAYQLQLAQLPSLHA